MKTETARITEYGMELVNPYDMSMTASLGEYQEGRFWEAKNPPETRRIEVKEVKGLRGELHIILAPRGTTQNHQYIDRFNYPLGTLVKVRKLEKPEEDNYIDYAPHPEGEIKVLSEDYFPALQEWESGVRWEIIEQIEK